MLQIESKYQQIVQKGSEKLSSLPSAPVLHHGFPGRADTIAHWTQGNIFSLRLITLIHLR